MVRSIVYEDRLANEEVERRGRRRRLHDRPGEDLGRIISLSYGVFAFALTLLVLGLTIPVFDTTGLNSARICGHLGAALHSDCVRFVGYVFAFVMIAIWWMVHHRTFRFIRRYDSALIWINMAVLLEVAVMPFVLQRLSARYGVT